MQQPQPLRIPDSAFAFDQAYKSGPYPQLITSGWNDRTAHIYPLLMLMTEKVTEERQKLYNGVKWQQVIVGISKACQMEKEDVQVLVFEQEAILLFRLQTQGKLPRSRCARYLSLTHQISTQLSERMPSSSLLPSEPTSDRTQQPCKLRKRPCKSPSSLTSRDNSG